MPFIFRGCRPDQALRSKGQQITPWAGFSEAFCVHNENVSWLGFGQCIVDGQVVVGSAIDGEGRAAKPLRRVDRTNTAVERTRLALSFVNGGCRKVLCKADAGEASGGMARPSPIS